MKKVIDFLKEDGVMTLATSDHDIPRASILEYYMVGDSIIFATAQDSIKAANLRNNKHVSMSVFSGSKFVTIDGIVTEPTQAEIEGYNKQLLEEHPEFKEALKDKNWHAYFRIVPETAYLNDIAKGVVPSEIYRA